MQLKFQTNKLRYLKPMMHEIRMQEETIDTIVPDSCPDILTIIDCYAYVVLRGKDCRDGCVVVSGGVKACLLYEPEDGSSPQSMDMYLPFTTKIENTLLTEDTFVQCSLRICYVDTKIINSRKAMLRVGILTEANAYIETDETIYTLEHKEPVLQIKERSQQLKLALECAEKSFDLRETRELPVGNPPIHKIYKFYCQTEVSDQKLVGDKAVFKGTLWCKILYFSEDGTMYNWNLKLPYSQFCNLTKDYDDESLCAMLTMTGCDYEVEPGSENRRIAISIHMLAQCLVEGCTDIALIEDAYTTEGELEAEWHIHEMELCLDKQRQTLPIHLNYEAQFSEILDQSIYADRPEILHENGMVKIRMPYYIRLLGTDKAGKLCGFSDKTDAAFTLALDEHAQVMINQLPVFMEDAALPAQFNHMKFNVDADITCFTKQQMRTLCDGSISEEEKKVRPAVILRYIQQEESLWNIAKQSRTAIQNIQIVNHLNTEYVSPGTVLLMPMS